MIDHLNDSNATPPSSNLPETNLCGYDSFLHATICSNVNNNLHNAALHSSPIAAIVTPQRISSTHQPQVQQQHHHHNKKLLKTKNHQITPPTITATVLPIQHQQPQNRTKLNTSLVNHLNPNLSAEQKLSRTINHVEKWLTDRDHQITNNKNDKNNHSHKMKGTTKPIARSKSKEEILLKEKSHLKIVEDVEKSSKKLSKHVTSAKTTPEHLSNKIKQGLIMEYASIPVNADPSECENLLRGSDEDTNNTSATPSTVHRYVHEHIHHHYHHFENDEA